MTFDAREKSRYDGQPLECYRFSQGGKIWLWTSADVEVALPIGLFVPETIGRGSIEFNAEDTSQSFELHVPRTNPVAQLFIPGPPLEPIGLIAYAAHRGEESSPITTFIGHALTAVFDGSQATIVCSPITRVFNQQIPARAVQTQCNHFVYSQPCGQNPLPFTEDVTVTTVDGNDITSNDFLLHPDGWYRNGKIVHPTEGPRFIVEHVGDTVTLVRPFLSLPSLTVVKAVRGCNRLMNGDCREIFGDPAGPPDGNVLNHLGFLFIPKRNPHTFGVG